MTKTNNLIKVITDMINNSKRQKIRGQNILIKNLFDFVRKQVNLQCEILFLCTNYGLVLDSSTLYLGREIIGYSISVEKLRQYHMELAFNESSEGYIIISTNHPETCSVIENLKSNVDGLLKIIKTNEQYKLSLLKSFDSVRNAISIFDKDANLLFANENFCKTFHIDNRDYVIGMHIHDVMKRYGIKVQSMESNDTHLSMMDVLKTGKERLDCSVRVESKYDSNYVQFVDNDMYPILDESGGVIGMIEISRSHQQVMKRTRKIMGLAAEYNFKDILGYSPAIREKINLAKEFSLSSGNVLITGESGVGKELFAQSVHNYSSRSKGPFVALNCASFPADLIESELFGYVEGAFTGASKKGQIGKIELADGGTLFLDEIGELPYYFQSKLLRVLETWVITRVGSPKEVSVDVRLVAATNRKLKEMVDSGLFRQDLYYRLQVLEIEIPPLRRRLNDIIILAEHFLKISAEQNGKSVKQLDKDAKKLLKEYDWPGNARELRNFINRIDLLSKEQIITANDIYIHMNAKEYGINMVSEENPEERISKRKAEVNASYTNLLNEALSITGGNKKEAAELLGISRKTLYRFLDKYN